MFRSIKSSVSDSTVINDTPMPEEYELRIRCRVRVTIPLTVYHIPKVLEVDINGKQGKTNENIAVWKGKYISANFPYMIEVFQRRGENLAKFFAHLKDERFEHIG